MQHSKPRYSLEEAFELLGISRAVGYLRITEGALNTVGDGRKTFISAVELDRYADTPHGPVEYPAKKAAAAQVTTRT
jgi:hypothetical protein